MPQTLSLADGSRIAYHAVAGCTPSVVFLGGYASDMTGTKALALEAHCVARGRAFVRFDYLGHGASSGRFEEGTIGRWARDAVAVIDRVAAGPLVLVGSSMGGWIMVLAARSRPDRVRGLVGVAAAPDFAEDLLWARLDTDARRRLQECGVIDLPNPYGERPTPVTREFLEEARRHRVLGSVIPLRCPVRLIHGLADPDVPWETSLRLAHRLESADVTLTLIKGAGHRLSEGRELARILEAVDELCDGRTGDPALRPEAGSSPPP